VGNHVAPITLQVRVPAGDDRHRWLLLHAESVLERTADGEPARILGIGQNIIGTWEARQLLALQGEELERRVLARTLELTTLSSELDEVNRLAVEALAPSLDRIDRLLAALLDREAAAPAVFHAELGRIGAAVRQLRAVAQEARARADAAVLPLRDRWARVGAALRLRSPPDSSAVANPA
jgi:hypothetical protein